MCSVCKLLQSSNVTKVCAGGVWLAHLAVSTVLRLVSFFTRAFITNVTVLEERQAGLARAKLKIRAVRTIIKVTYTQKSGLLVLFTTQRLLNQSPATVVISLGCNYCCVFYFLFHCQNFGRDSGFHAILPHQKASYFASTLVFGLKNVRRTSQNSQNVHREPS